MRKILSSPWGVPMFIVLLLVIDQIVKIYIKTHMTINEHIAVFGEWFYIRFIENNGAAYGMELGGDYGKLALSLFRIIAVTALSIYIGRLIKRSAPTGVIVGFSLILAGALGNILDSMFYGLIFTESTYTNIAQLVPCGTGYETFLHGQVVDMLYFPIIKTTYPEWVPNLGGTEFIFFSPIFNIADTYISVGFLYLLIFKRSYFK